MKNELRRNNIVGLGCENVTITTISRVWIQHIAEWGATSDRRRVTEYKPIMLTIDWMIKFGFKYNSFSLLYEKGNVCGEFCDGFCVIMNNTEYVITTVHQLQNLYFALTREELTI